MAKVCDIYLPLDERESANREVWPVAVPQLRQLEGVVRECGWEPNVLNPEMSGSSFSTRSRTPIYRERPRV